MSNGLDRVRCQYCLSWVLEALLAAHEFSCPDNPDNQEVEQ